MAKTGIHIKPCNTGSAEAHNRRDKAYLERLDASGKKTYDIYRDETHLNRSWVNPDYQGRTLDQVLADLQQEVKEKTGRAMQAKATPIREGVCPILPTTQLSDFQPVVDWYAAHGAAVISIDLHHDEGHTDPLTGERKHNHHAHVIVDYIDHRTGRSVKLTKEDISELQGVVAKGLHMERGTSKAETGAEHLAAQEYREKKAGENAARLEAKVADLENQLKANQEEADRAQRSMEEAQQRESDAIEKARTAEKAASREQLRSNAADVGARVLSVFGRGAVAEAHADRDDALERAEAAEQQAAADREAAEAAEKARILAVASAEDARRAKTRAEREKAEYGRQMYENGVADGVKQGRASVQASIAPLQQQLAAKQDELDRAVERAETAEKEVKNMKAWNPSMQNWQQSLKDMRQAGMEDKQIQQVFQRGFLEGVQVPVYKHQGQTYTQEAKVSLNPSTRGGMFAWFNGSRLSAFLEKAVEKVKEALGLNQGRGMHM